MHSNQTRFQQEELSNNCWRTPTATNEVLKKFSSLVPLFLCILLRVVCRVCERGETVQGFLTLFCSGVAQTCHDDRVVELKEQLGIEEEDGEEQEEKVKEEGRDRVKENAK